MATVNIAPAILGVVISAAVLLDQLFSNFKRMMAETEAAEAVDRTIRKVQNNYNDQVLDVIKANQQGNSAVAYDLLLALARISAKTVRDEMDRIKAHVGAANIQFLSSLNLDQPATTTLPQAPEIPTAKPRAPAPPAPVPPKDSP